MTIHEAVNQVDEMKPNSYSLQVKVRWLNQLDGQIYENILKKHEGCPEAFAGYGVDTPLDTVLLVQPPHDELYIHWLESKIDYYNGEVAKYNNSNAMYSAAYDEFERWYNRNYMPVGCEIRYF